MNSIDLPDFHKHYISTSTIFPMSQNIFVNYIRKDINIRLVVSPTTRLTAPPLFFFPPFSNEAEIFLHA